MELSREQAEKDFVDFKGAAGVYKLHKLLGYMQNGQIHSAIKYINSLGFNPEYKPGLREMPGMNPSFDVVVTDVAKQAVRIDNPELMTAILTKVIIPSAGFFELFQVTGYVVKDDAAYPKEKKGKVFRLLLNPAILESLEVLHRQFLLRNIAKLPENHVEHIGYIYDAFSEAEKAAIKYDSMLEASTWNDKLQLPGNIEHTRFFLGFITDQSVIEEVLVGALASVAAVTPTDDMKTRILAPAVEALVGEFYPKIKKPVSEAIAIAALETKLPNVFEALVQDVADKELLTKLFNRAIEISPNLSLQMMEKVWNKCGDSVPEEALSTAFVLAARMHEKLNPAIMQFIWNKCGEKVSEHDLVEAAPFLSKKHPGIFSDMVSRIKDDGNLLQVFDAVTVVGSGSALPSKSTILKACSGKLDKERLYAATKAAVINGDGKFLGSATEGLGGEIISSGNGDIFAKEQEGEGGNELLFLAARYKQGEDSRGIVIKDIDIALGLMSRLSRMGADHCPGGAMLRFTNSGLTPKTVILSRIKAQEDTRRKFSDDDRLRIFDLDMKKMEAQEVAAAATRGGMEERFRMMQKVMELANGDPEATRLMLGFLGGSSPHPENVSRGSEQPLRLVEGVQPEQGRGDAK